MMVNLGPTGYSPKPGDIGLVRISGAGGFAIRWLQALNGDGHDDYEHAFIVSRVDAATGTVWIVEAEPGGAREVELTYDNVRWLKCPDQFRDAVSAVARHMASEKIPYSWADYAACGLHRFHVPVPHLKKYIQTSKHMMCSQLVDRCANYGGWHLFRDGRWDGFVTPGALDQLWKQQTHDELIERFRTGREGF